MPIYEFRCGDCNKITNYFSRKIDTESKVPCEHCESANTSRMMSAFGRSCRRYAGYSTVTSDVTVNIYI